MTSISIIVPVYKNHDSIQHCVESIISGCSENTEIILVDNDHEKNAGLAAYEQFENIRVIHETQPGSYAARNAGINCSKGTLLGFTDSDCMVDRCWIKNAVKILSSMKSPGFIGGQIIMFPGNERKLNVIEKHEMFFSLKQQRLMRYANFAATANLWAHREVFDKAGLFDASLKSGGDKEWCRRVSHAGFKGVYAPDVIVYHPVRTNFRDFNRKSRRVGAGFCNTFLGNENLLGNFYKMLMIGKHHTKLLLKNRDFTRYDKVRIFFIIILERCQATAGFLGKLIFRIEYR